MTARLFFYTASEELNIAKVVTTFYTFTSYIL